MADQAAADGYRKSSLEIRERLLAALDVPRGTATVSRRPGKEMDTIVVQVVSPAWLDEAGRFPSWEGHPVACEVVRPLKVVAR